MTDLGEADGADVLTVGGGGPSRPHGPGQQAAQSLHGDAPVDGVGRRRGHTADTSAGKVVAHRLNDGGDGGGQHGHHSGYRHRGYPPLTWGSEDKHRGREGGREGGRGKDSMMEVMVAASMVITPATGTVGTPTDLAE